MIINSKLKKLVGVPEILLSLFAKIFSTEHDRDKDKDNENLIFF